MTDWNILAQAGKELTRAFDLLDRAADTPCTPTAAIITKMGLVDAAEGAVGRDNRLLGH